MIEIDQVIAHWSFYDAFQKVEIVERGCTRWIPCGMPLIPPDVLGCCFYLYKTVADARSGRSFGGTGFLVGVPSALDSRVFHDFGVTNWHVAVRGGFSVMRFNRSDGGVGIFERDPADWIWRPKWHDLAIIGLPDIEWDFPAEATAINRDLLLTKEETDRLQIGPGADVFMIGRFVDHDGRSTNIPSARFGHVSIMPVQGIKQPTNSTLESYVLDVHSRTGYSGSPVFVYRTPGTDLRFTNIVTGPGHNLSSFWQFIGVSSQRNGKCRQRARSKHRLPPAGSLAKPRSTAYRE